MPVVQATLSFVVELREFHNVDLYHRGYYQIRTYLKTNGQPSTNTGSTYVKSTAFVEPPLLWERASTRFKVPEAVKASYIEPSVSVPTYIPEKACSKTLLIMYRDETAKICDVFEQRVLIQVDPINLEDSLMRNDLFLCIELWFVEDPLDKPFSPGLLTKVCERQLRIHITPSRGLHYHFTVFFDYFHLCAIELALYGALTNISSNIISWPKISPHNTPLQANSPIVNLAQQTWHSILCNVKQVSRYHFALAMHRHICQVLLAARESMLLFWRESIPYLPANVKPRIEAVDFRSKLDSLTEMTQILIYGSAKRNDSTGNSCDLRLVRVYLQLALPDCHLQFLMSECNQQDTFGGFDIMSEKLVREITDYIDEMDDEPKRISFIGHSMGCVIIRAALLDPRMKPYLSKLHTFLSLSGPHLGTVYNSSGLINMGIWVMQKIKKSESLSQLRMRDDPDLRNTYLYRLSTSPGLDLFRYVLLVGSPQDRYVPYHSTRIELCKAAIRDPSALGVIYMEMVTNLLQRLIKSTRTAVVRYDVHYSLTNSANTLIGRAAHIAVLDSEIFLEKFICVSGAKYFR
ncbi:unnamed protein product [Heterobilharzia americana]|nr:unnamed protein product [Heterobilharzia americana]